MKGARRRALGRSRAGARQRELRRGGPAARIAAAGGPLVGLDVAGRPRLEARRREWAPAVLAVVVAGLLLASLRVEILRIRYDLAEVARQERALLEERNAALLEARRLRDPRRLRALAEERGFTRPERVVRLEWTTPPGRAPASAAPQRSRRPAARSAEPRP